MTMTDASGPILSDSVADLDANSNANAKLPPTRIPVNPLGFTVLAQGDAPVVE
jgi:hypothetical protein